MYAPPITTFRVNITRKSKKINIFPRSHVVRFLQYHKKTEPCAFLFRTKTTAVGFLLPTLIEANTLYVPNSRQMATPIKRYWKEVELIVRACLAPRPHHLIFLFRWLVSLRRRLALPIVGQLVAVLALRQSRATVAKIATPSRGRVCVERDGTMYVCVCVFVYLCAKSGGVWMLCHVRRTRWPFIIVLKRMRFA